MGFKSGMQRWLNIRKAIYHINKQQKKNMVNSIVAEKSYDKNPASFANKNSAN